MNRLAPAVLAVLALAAPAGAKQAPYGILLLAHGGGPEWNEAVDAVGRGLAGGAPVEIAFGMADAASIQAAVDRLESRRAAKIVAVPLFINSSSEVLEHKRYVLGLSEKPSEVFREAMERVMAERGGARGHGGHGRSAGAAAHAHHRFSLERLKTRLPLVLTPALDDHPLVGAILLDRARVLSREPSRETVILVGHGPVDDKSNAEWLKTMARLGRAVKAQGRFKSVRSATIRDDSPPEVKSVAAAALRRMVEEGSAGGGRVLVIPYLIAPGGIESRIVDILEGLDYAWDGRTICPHPNVAAWAAERAAQGASKADMRRFK